MHFISSSSRFCPLLTGPAMHVDEMTANIIYLCSDDDTEFTSSAEWHGGHQWATTWTGVVILCKVTLCLKFTRSLTPVYRRVHDCVHVWMQLWGHVSVYEHSVDWQDSQAVDRPALFKTIFLKPSPCDCPCHLSLLAAMLVLVGCNDSHLSLLSRVVFADRGISLYFTTCFKLIINDPRVFHTRSLFKWATFKR